MIWDSNLSCQLRCRRNKQGAGPPKQDPKCRWFSRNTKENIAKIYQLLLDPWVSWVFSELTSLSNDIQVYPPETNIALENWTSQKETSIPTIIFRCYLSFREGIFPLMQCSSTPCSSSTPCRSKPCLHWSPHPKLQVSHEKEKNLLLSIESWLFNRHPYNGFFTGKYNPQYNPTNQGFSHCSGHLLSLPGRENEAQSKYLQFGNEVPIPHTQSAIPRSPIMKEIPKYSLLVKVARGVFLSGVLKQP